MATTQMPARATTALVGTSQDQLRQVLNVVLSIAQIAAIVWTFVVNDSFSFAVRPAYEPPVIPAAYTFTVWFVIYAGALAYAVYQALPAQRTNPLLRRIGWWSASAFGAATLWAITAGLNWQWLTDALIFALFGSLLAAFIGFSREHAPHTRAERLLVVAPLSIYIGYVTIATVANTASALAQTGQINLAGIPPTAWAIAMLLVAGLIAGALTRWSRGNASYALTAIWGLVGIVIANVADKPNSFVAVAAGIAALLIGLALASTRLLAPAAASRVSAA